MMILFQVLEMKLEQVGFLLWLSSFILPSSLLEMGSPAGGKKKKKGRVSVGTAGKDLKIFS